MEKLWELYEQAPQEVKDRFPKLHPIVVQLLVNRGLTGQEEVDRFLTPDYGQDTHDPFLFREMESACKRVWEAFEKGERIMVFGDYDADGVTGSVILYSVFRDILRELGSDESLVSSRFPHREKEGYGIRKEAVLEFAENGVGLLITVDCGIGNSEEISLAAGKGIDTIVVDHHRVPQDVPDCIIIHPLLEGEEYPNKSLAAAAVAFKFASAFMSFAAGKGVDLPGGSEKWLLDLVAIATVTDFMPLTGENRTLEKFGLLVLNKTRRPGLLKLIEVAGLRLGELDTTSVGFYLGPRINAASRMEHAKVAFDLLVTEDEKEAVVLSDKLNLLNRDRQRFTEDIMRQARRAIEAEGRKKINVVVGEGWPAGIVGLVAGRMVTEFGAPVFVIGAEGERYVGSGRSIEGFDLVEAIESAKDSLERFGGHAQACGVTISGKDNYVKFREAVSRFAEERLSESDLRPKMRIDSEISTSQITWGLVGRLLELEPHGEGNPRPLFLLRDLTITIVSAVGKNGRHVRIGVRGDAPKEMKIIGFGLAASAEGLSPGSVIDAVVEIGVNEWNGTREIQLKAVDIRRSEK